MITFCTNAETVRSYATDPTRLEGCSRLRRQSLDDPRLVREIADLAVNSISNSDLARIAGSTEFQVESTFRPWNGGIYSDQAERVGLHRIGTLLVYDSDTSTDAAWDAADRYEALLRERALEFSQAIRECRN